ncbi:MAG: DUF4214 domain-containing protein [Clostridiales bacterium]|nr:DUF4214 domain-containing protein [Clostridiales bacterium]
MRSKRLLSFLLVLVMALGLIPAIPVSAAGYYDLWIRGSQLDSGHLSGTGWSYTPGTNTLTLTNANFTSTGQVSIRSGNEVKERSCFIYSEISTRPLTIELVGSNTISLDESDTGSAMYPNFIYGIVCSNSPLIIKGSGSLDITLYGGEGCGSIGITTTDLRIQGGNVSVTTEERTNGNMATYPVNIGTNSSLSVTGGTLTLQCSDKGVFNYPFVDLNISNYEVWSGTTLVNHSDLTSTGYRQYDNLQFKRATTRHSVDVVSGGHGSAYASVSNAVAGANVTLTATPDEGYTFKEWQAGWYSDAIVDPYAPVTSFSMGTSDAMITAVFELNSFDIPCNIVWNDDDNSEGIRPDSVEVDIFADGTQLTDQSITLTEVSGWSSQFSGLPIRDAGCNIIEYNVGLASHPNGYRLECSGDQHAGFTYTLTKQEHLDVDLSSGITRYNDHSFIDELESALYAARAQGIVNINGTFMLEVNDWCMVVDLDRDGDYDLIFLDSLNEIRQTDDSGLIGDYTVSGIDTGNYNSVTVSFPVPAHNITVSDDGNGMGFSSASAAPEGTQITLTATANEGYRFKEWQVISGGVTLSDPSAVTTTFNLGTADVEVRAVFEVIPEGPSGDPVTPDPVTPEPQPGSDPSGEQICVNPTIVPAIPTDVPINVTTEPGVAGFVERLYTVALGRPSDPAGKQDWIDAITLRGESGASCARGFLYSPEFLNKECSNEEFVAVLYSTFFNRTPDNLGFTAWVEALNNGASKEQVIEGFINSTEWANLCLRYGIRNGGTGVPNIEVEPNSQTIDFATRLYTTCLGRNADEAGLMAWARQLANQRDTGTGAARGFFFSEEFTGQNVSNDEYVNRLYRTFMGREADEAGFSAWVAQLDSGVSREEVFDGFAQSPEFTVICASYGIIR